MVITSLVAGPFIGFDYEDIQKKTVCYKVLTVSDEKQLPDFSVSITQNFKRETLYKINHLVFERFRFEVPMKDERSVFKYKVNQKSFDVTIPGLKVERLFDFCTCNDFLYPKDKAESKEPEHLWRIYQEMISLNSTVRPDIFLFGGDQGYFDGVFETLHLSKWSTLCRANQKEAVQQPFTEEMAEEVESYYLRAYLERFSNKNDFGKTLSYVPSWMTLDDHDYYDSFGSYPDILEQCPVVQGIKDIAKKYYYLFQLQSFPSDEMSQGEFVGKESTKMRIVGRTAILAPDTRNQRSLSQITSPEDWKMIFDFLEKYQQNYDHALFIFPVPFVYANFDEIEKVLACLNSYLSDEAVEKIPIASIRHRLKDKFGQIGIDGDLVDRWDNHHHIEERLAVLKQLISVRLLGKSVLILSGDVHHACETEIRSKQKLPDINDPLLIKNAISSPMVNKVSSFAHLIPALFSKDQHVTDKAIGRLTKLQPVGLNATTATRIIATQNFLRVNEVENKGLKTTWYASPNVKKTDNYSSLLQYQSFTPIYVPAPVQIVAPVQRQTQYRRCMIL